MVLAGPEVTGCDRATGRWVLAAAILGSGITFIDGTVVNVALPVLQRDLHADVSTAQWIVELYSLMLSALILVGGSLGDRFGRKRVFSAGVLLFALASTWCALSPGATQLIAARGVQGVGAALLVPGSLALISANFGKQKRGQAIGTWSGYTSIAAGVGPLLGGWIIDHASWRWIFVINIPLAIAVLLITWRLVPESRDEQAGGPLDWLGAVLATLGLGGIVFALIELNVRGHSPLLVAVSAAVGIASIASFPFVEAHVRDPMVPPALFRSRTFTGANLLTLFLYAALGGLLFFLPFDLIQVHGYSATGAGAALLPFVLTMFLLSHWAGGLVDRIGSKVPLVIGPLVAAAGLALFALPGAAHSSYWSTLFPAIMAMSIGMSVSVAPLTTTVMGAVPDSRAGVASGINNAVSRTAGLLAVAAFGAVMVTVFCRSLTSALLVLPLSEDARKVILGRSAGLLNLRMPAGVSGSVQSAIKSAAAAAFVSGFRVVVLAAAGLAVASAVAAWLLVGGKPRQE